jgi:calcineurin-like phosphoesterase family protein
MNEIPTYRLLGELFDETFMLWLTSETFLEYKGKAGYRVRKPETWKRIHENRPVLCLQDFGHSADEDCDYPFTYGDTWVSSDHHFGHKNIINYSERPFADLDEMQEELIRRHNAVVPPDATWICVGDFAFLPTDRANAILERMNGDRKILVVGNHDIHKNGLRPLAFDHVCVTSYFEVPHIAFEDGMLQFFLSHYPYPDLPPTVFNIHGHEHVSRQPTKQPNYINVNVEMWDYTPVRLIDLINMAESRRISIDTPRYYHQS